MTPVFPFRKVSKLSKMEWDSCMREPQTGRGRRQG
jgi:hypothetical protein